MERYQNGQEVSAYIDGDFLQAEVLDSRYSDYGKWVYDLNVKELGASYKYENIEDTWVDTDCLSLLEKICKFYYSDVHRIYRAIDDGVLEMKPSLVFDEFKLKMSTIEDAYESFMQDFAY